MTSIQEIFPIVKISNSMILSGIGDITWGYKLQLPEAFSITPDQYKRIYGDFLSVFSSLPEGCVITQQDDYKEVIYDKSEEFKSYTLKRNHQKIYGRPLLAHSSYIYISYPDKHISALSSNKNCAIKLNNYLKNPYKNFPKTLRQANQIKKEIEVSLNSIDNIRVSELDDSLLKENIYKHWSFEEKYSDGATIPEIRKSDGYLRVGNKYVGVISLLNHGELTKVCKKHKSNIEESGKFSIEKGIELQLSNFYSVGFNLPFNHTVTRTLIIRSKEKTNLKFFFDTSREGALAAVGIAEAKKRMQDIMGFKDAVTNRSYTYADMSCNVIVPTNTLSELEDKSLLVRKELRAVNDGQTYEEPYVDALPLWVATTPGYTRANYRTFITVLEHGLTYLTYESARKGNMEGHRFTDRLGNPTVIDLWKHPSINNRNGIVEGGSGTGKSFTVNNIVDQDLEKGYHVIILDVGHSYRNQCTFNKGMYYDSSDLSKLSFNLFKCDKDETGHYKPNDDKQLFIQSILITIWKGDNIISNEENAILLEIVENYYKHINQINIEPDLISFHAFLGDYNLVEKREHIFNLEAFITTLEPFTKGRYSALLNAKNQTDITNERFIVFDIESVSEDPIAFPVVGLIIMEMVMEKVRKLPGSVRKRFLIDEGWKVLKGSLSGFVEYLYRTFRKNEGSVFLATQAISDLPQNVGEDMAKALINNADILMLMRRGSAQNYKDLQKWLSLTDFQIEMMKDLKKRDELGYREFYLGLAETAIIMRLESHQDTIATYSSKAEDKERIIKHYKRTENIEYAIKQYSEEEIKIHYLKSLYAKGKINEATFQTETKRIVSPIK